MSVQALLRPGLLTGSDRIQVIERPYVDAQCLRQTIGGSMKYRKAAKSDLKNARLRKLYNQN